MLTDDQARTLLNAAADTIDVPPAKPIPLPPRRPPWVPGMAIAAALVVVAGTLAIVFDGRSNHADDRISPVGPPPSAAAQPWPAPSATELFRLAPDQMPSLFGYTAAAATALLQSHAIKVTVRHQATCGVTGRVERTQPAAGVPLDGGPIAPIRDKAWAAATLYVGTDAPAMKCPYEDVVGQAVAYRFLDWANGRGPAPRFAKTVTVYVVRQPDIAWEASDYRKVGVLHGGGTGRDSVLDRDHWHGLLDSLADATRRVEVDRSHPKHPRYIVPTLSVGEIQPGVGALAGQRFTIGLDHGAGPRHQLTSGTLQLDNAGAITAVYLDPTAEAGNRVVPPDVVGDTLAFAQRRLHQAGYAVVITPAKDWNWQTDGCAGVPLALGQSAVTTYEVQLARTPFCLHG